MLRFLVLLVIAIAVVGYLLNRRGATFGRHANHVDEGRSAEEHRTPGQGGRNVGGFNAGP